jgi:HTH-type transcriptional regulator/antitoxin HigA
MEIRPIRTQTDYQAALREIESLFDAAENTP